MTGAPEQGWGRYKHPLISERSALKKEPMIQDGSRIQQQSFIKRKAVQKPGILNHTFVKP